MTTAGFDLVEILERRQYPTCDFFEQSDRSNIKNRLINFKAWPAELENHGAGTVLTQKSWLIHSMQWNGSLTFYWTQFTIEMRQEWQRSHSRSWK